MMALSEDFNGLEPPPFILFNNPRSVVLVYRYVLGLVFLLGFLGNSASILTFKSINLRKTSTGFLFLILAISDTLILLILIYDFVEVAIFDGPIFIEKYDDLCRFRIFTRTCLQFSSAWILTLIAFDRWFRAQFPFKVNKYCTIRNAALGVILIFGMGICYSSHLMIPHLFGSLTPGIATEACGPIHPFSNYGSFYFSRWPIIQVNLRKTKIS